MMTPGAEALATRNTARTLIDLLELEQIDGDQFRAGCVFSEQYPLFGGQVAAQALRAAGLTVDGERLPHSLHAYFLRQGDAAHPVVYQVVRERDGRSFSARRVVARQHGSAIFSMLASFHVGEGGPEAEAHDMPPTARPGDCAPYRMPRVFSFEGRRPEQDYPHHELLTRFWTRCTDDLRGDALLNACAVTYISDHSNGAAPLDTDTHRTIGSLDHALWFHRPVTANDWLLMDLVPHVVAKGRAWYTGSVYQADGTLVASLAQQAVYRAATGKYFPHER